MSPKASFEICKGGVRIVNFTESYMNSLKMFKVDTVMYLPLSELERYHQYLPADKILIFADAVGLKSRESVLFLEAQGYENAVNMAGGYVPVG